MRELVREPSLGLVAPGLVGLLALFVVLPQVQVVLAPGLDGYVQFLRCGPNWLRATLNSLVVMLLSTTSALAEGAVCVLVNPRRVHGVPEAEA
jgi:ABC-type Fe3+ transport system permease subunit